MSLPNSAVNTIDPKSAFFFPCVGLRFHTACRVHTAILWVHTAILYTSWRARPSASIDVVKPTVLPGSFPMAEPLEAFSFQIFFANYPSYRIFGHRHEILNVVEKITNYIV